jgi:hypothetical protein
MISILFITGIALAQTEYPTQDTDYKSTYNKDDEGSDYISYSYLLENLGSETLLFYNFRIVTNTDKYEILQDIPGDILILYPYQKATYFRVKVYTNGPAINWNSRFLKPSKEQSNYPVQDKDYVYFWEGQEKDNGYTAYIYYLKNISNRNIKFYDFSIKNEGGGIYYLIQNLIQDPMVAKSNESFVLVKFDLKNETVAPDVNWHAIFSGSETASSDFCTGLTKVLDAAADSELTPIKGAIKESAEESLLGTETYYCTVHIDGVQDEVIENLIFLWDYYGVIGPAAPLEDIEMTFEEFRQKISSCLPSDFTETISGEDEYGSYKKAEYKGTLDGLTYYVTLKIVDTYSGGNYRLELSVDGAY